MLNMIFVIIIEDFGDLNKKKNKLIKIKLKFVLFVELIKDKLEKKEKNLRFILIKLKIFGVLLIICLGWFVIFKKLMQLIVKLWKILERKESLWKMHINN